MKKIFLLLLVIVMFGCISQHEGNNEEIELGNEGIEEEVIEMSRIVMIETNKGNIEIELNFEDAPITTDNFLTYVESGFYENVIFHRVIKNFMIQGGGFTPGGKQKSVLNPITLESKNGLKNLRGTIAMARTKAPDSATSQFFINTKDNDFLNYNNINNPGYAVFGKVVKGMDVVDAIENVKTSSKGYYDDWPTEDVIIIKMYVKK